jgi:HSP20 family protein
MSAASSPSAKPEDKAVAKTPRADADQRHPLQALREEMDRLYDEFVSQFPLIPFGRRRALAEAGRPSQGLFGGASLVSLDVVEREGEYRITAELPGMEEKDIDLAVANGVLTLRGEKKMEREERKEDYYLSERRFGAVERSFRLPENADPEKISASFKNGVLTIVLPKNPAATAAGKKIAIKAA